MTHHFDDAWQEALNVARRATQDGFDLVLIRDLLGRASIVVDDGRESNPYPPQRQVQLAEELTRRCEPFVAPQPVLLTTSLFSPVPLTKGPDLLEAVTRDEDQGRGRLAILERGLVGQEWSRVSADPKPNRVTLYGFKGGVGRSTAATVLANYLATLGNCVLIVDLDLESPGVSAIALNTGDMPSHGIIDFLVEAGVGNADGLDCVGRSSRLRVAGNGEVWIAPAGGRPRNGYTYLPKLNRAYLDYPMQIAPDDAEDRSACHTTFASRLSAAIDYCAAEVSRQSRPPDVVLLDSRAGIHDVAAVAITQLSDLSLLFGIDNAQTWSGYRELFQQWRVSGELTRRIRERLKMVGAMVPASTEDAYLATFQDRAQLLFSESLYDEASADDSEAFNPPLADNSAPHYPLPILFTTDLVGVDVSAGTDWLGQDFVTTAFSRFVRGAADLILGESGVAP